MATKTFTVIRDTREKENNGYWFEPTDKCTGTIEQTVKIGDYTMKGFEHILCIERKKSVVELANNCSENRFYKELSAMKAFKYKFIILEFNWYDIGLFPHHCGLPKRIIEKINITPAHIYGLLLSCQMKYGISVIPCGNAKVAEATVYDIFEKVMKYEY